MGRDNPKTQKETRKGQRLKMPNYEYECQDCDHRFEKLQAYGEEPVTTCPKCQGEVKRLISVSHPKRWKPSTETKTHRVGNHDIPIHQTEDGHWEQGGIR